MSTNTSSIVKDTASIT